VLGWVFSLESDLENAKRLLEDVTTIVDEQQLKSPEVSEHFVRLGRIYWSLKGLMRK